MPEFLHKSKTKNEAGTIVSEWLIHKPKNPILFNCVRCFPGGSDGKEFICNAEHLGTIPEIRKVPWRRAWQPTPIFLPGESPQTEEPGGDACIHRDANSWTRLNN